MKCSRCGKPLAEGASFCVYCGEKQPARVCARCGQPLTGGGRYCEFCGAPTDAPVPARDPVRKETGGKKLQKGTVIWIAVACVLTLTFGGILLWRKALGPARTRREIAAVSEMVEQEIVPYTNERGEVPEENAAAAAEAVYTRVWRAASGGEYAYVERNGNAVLIGLKSGGCYVYLPPEPVGSPEAPAEPPAAQQATPVAGAGGRIATLQPSCEETQASNPQIWAYPDIAAQGIMDALDGYTFYNTGSASDDNRDNREVNLDFLKRLSDYSVVIWHGHGGNSAHLGSYLATGVMYQDSYWADLQKGRIVYARSGNVCVTPAFFDAYLGRNDNAETVIYLAACESGMDNSLANVFLAKGFDCVIANSATIARTYNLQMERAFIAGMSGENGEFLTSGEALAGAKARHGEQDPYFSEHAVALLFGSPDVCFANAAKPKPSPTPKATASPVPEVAATPAAATPAPAAPDVRIDEEKLAALAVVCSILPPFDSADELTKEERLSILHAGLWADGLAMFGNKFAEAAYYGEDATLSPEEAETYVRQTLGVGVTNRDDDFASDNYGIYNYGDGYEVLGSDFNRCAVLCDARQLGDGRLQASFDVYPQVDGVGNPNTAKPNLVMTVEESDGYWGYTVVSIEASSY